MNGVMGSSSSGKPARGDDWAYTEEIAEYVSPSDAITSEANPD